MNTPQAAQNPAAPRWRSVAAALLVVAVIFGAYRSALFTVYGYNDDYLHVWNVRLGRFDPAHNEISSMGRPLSSFALYALFSLGDKVEKLAWVRLVSLVGLAGLTLSLMWAMTRWGRRSLGFAGTVALLVALSPAGGVCAAWATAACLPFALLLSMGAGCLIHASLLRAAGSSNGGGRRAWPSAARGLAGAILLLLVACTLWQAAAPFALFAVLVSAWLDLDNDPAALRRVWMAFGVYVVSALLYLALLRLALRAGLLPRVGLERVTFATDVFGKVPFLLGAMRTALTSWGRFQPGWREVAVGVFTGCGCLAALLTSSPARTGRRLLAVALVGVAGISPLLVANENNAACRSLLPLYALAAFLAVDGYSRLLRRWPARAHVTMAALLVLVAALAADYHVRWGIVFPNHREYTVLRRLVLEGFSEPPRHVVYLVPPYPLLTRTRLKGYWEYGVLSSSFWWVTKPFLSLLFEQIPPPAGTADASGKKGKILPRELDFQIHYREKENAGVPVIHSLPALLGKEGVWHGDDPRWGQVQRFTDGWIYLPWLGYLDERDFPHVWHHLLGDLDYIGTGPENLWFTQEITGPFHTSAVSFPSLLLSKRERWFWLADESESRLYLVDLQSPLRIPVGEQARAGAP